MEDLYEKIKRLERNRNEYFLHNPSSSHSDFCRKIREQSTQLQEEIPINVGGVAMRNYLVGKILNLCIDFDPKSEINLDLACRMDPTNLDAWLELGICVWKKPDLDKALMNFNEAVLRKRSPKALCLLSAAKRARLSSPAIVPKERLALIQECMKLCKEALELRPEYPFAWYSLGNTHIYRFFAIGQIQDKELTHAVNAYKKALSCNTSLPFINADLHVNFGVALQYKQRYKEALENFRRALQIEPHFNVPKDHVVTLEKFLTALQHGIDKKGSITHRRFKQIVNSMEQDKRKNEFTYLFPLLQPTSLEKLELGDNPDCMVVLKIVGVVQNDEEIPYSVVATDEQSYVVGLTMYNFSKKFFLIIGDSLVVHKPLLLELKDFQISSAISINLRLIRITDPVGLIKNGRVLGQEYRAYTNIAIQTKVD